MSKLNMYYDGNSEWVIAESPEKANEIWLEETGSDEDIYDDMNFTILDGDKEHHIYFEDMPIDLTDEETDEWLDQDPKNGWKKLTKTVDEWITELGAGWCGSSEVF